LRGLQHGVAAKCPKMQLWTARACDTSYRYGSIGQEEKLKRPKTRSA